jgi:hypothetical protein
LRGTGDSNHIHIEGDGADVIEQLYSAGLTDGLPVVPPTMERVGAMLAFTDLDAGQVLGTMPPSMAELRPGEVAANAVMAGCLPEYFPVVLAAVRALIDPDFNLFGIQATTEPATPALLVSGPVASRIGVNSGRNCLGPGNRANATIGRALRLCMLNIGGATAADMDCSTHGQAGKYTLCFAENEESSPWVPYHVERGFQPSDSAVTVFAVNGSTNIIDYADRTADGILRTLAASCATLGDQNVIAGGSRLLLICPEHAAILAGEGLTKSDVRSALFELGSVPVTAFSEAQLASIRHRRPGWFSATPEPSVVPCAESPTAIHLVVAGGAGPHSVSMPGWGSSWEPVTRLLPGAA